MVRLNDPSGGDVWDDDPPFTRAQKRDAVLAVSSDKQTGRTAVVTGVEAAAQSHERSTPAVVDDDLGLTLSGERHMSVVMRTDALSGTSSGRPLRRGRSSAARLCRAPMREWRAYTRSFQRTSATTRAIPLLRLAVATPLTVRSWHTWRP